MIAICSSVRHDQFRIKVRHFDEMFKLFFFPVLTKRIKTCLVPIKNLMVLRLNEVKTLTSATTDRRKYDI